MKVFPSSAANPEKWQFSFRSPRPAILPSVACTYDDHFHTGNSLARVDGEAAGLSHVFTGEVCNYISWQKKVTVRLDEWNYNLNENEDLSGSLLDICLLLPTYKLAERYYLGYYGL